MDATLLRPGDCLLYRPNGLFGFLISLKTWHAISHCECYIGGGKSVASRDGKGVNIYPWRDTQLTYILRPTQPFSLNAALIWFYQQARGQKYDWLGLLRFSWRARYVPDRLTSNRMFCSEFLTRWYRAGGLDLFPNDDADAIAPSQFLDASEFDLAWQGQ